MELSWPCAEDWDWKRCILETCMLRLFRVPYVSGQCLQVYSRLLGKWRFSTCLRMLPRSLPCWPHITHFCITCRRGFRVKKKKGEGGEDWLVNCFRYEVQVLREKRYHCSRYEVGCKKKWAKKTDLIKSTLLNSQDKKMFKQVPV
jgi:hypothetical protein